jgi:Tol biopolymer transport system component
MHLWTANLERDSSTPVTATVGSENWPNVTADGRRMAFASESIDFDLVDIPLDGTPPRKLIATSRNESEPTFNRDGSRYAYVSDKGGVLRIWTRNRTDPDVESVIVDPEQFPQGDTTLALGALAMSPDGERVAYQRYSENGGYRIWISTVRAAGPPVPLTTGLFYEDAPTWSPDGASIAFIMRNKEYVSGLAVMRVGSGAEPNVLLPNVPTLGVRPQWSPDGKWIVCDTTEGVMIVSPDGKEKRIVNEEFMLASTWAADSRHVYVLREADKLRHFALTSIDINTNEERVINPDLGPIPHASQPIRGLTLSGAGNRVHLHRRGAVGHLGDGRFHRSEGPAGSAAALEIGRESSVQQGFSKDFAQLGLYTSTIVSISGESPTMRRVLSIALLLGLCLAWQQGLLACGDKFFLVSRGDSFMRAYASLNPGTIVIYTGGSSAASKALADGRLQKYFSRAGHRVTVAKDQAALNEALQSAPVDVVMAGLNEAILLLPRVDALPSKPVLMPVEGAGDRDGNAHQFTATLKTTDRINGFLAKVEGVMKTRATPSSKRTS